MTVVDILFSKGVDPSCGSLLHWAVRREQSDALDVFCRTAEEGAPIEDRKPYLENAPLGGGTPLHLAAKLGKTDIVRYLLDKGADACCLDSNKDSPRDLAERKGHSVVGEMLKAAGGS